MNTKDAHTDSLFQVALPRFLWHTLTYQFSSPPSVGTITKVPLKKQLAWGLVIKPASTTDLQRVDLTKIKCVSELETHPVKLDPAYVSFLSKIAQYYHFPFGLVFRMSCPTPVLKKYREVSPDKNIPSEPLATLHETQKRVLENIKAGIEAKKQKHLIFGVTGSGKTEVYMHLADHVLKQNQKCLMIVPEIALTPQFVTRFRARIPYRITVLHSGLTSTQLQHNWYEANTDGPVLVIGTRSALFHPLPQLGMILMDEEHDKSYKQNDHLRYHAREVALFRSDHDNIPLIFGSATPSFELLHQVEEGQVSLHQLNARYGDISVPKVTLIQTPRNPQDEGWISPELKKRIDIALAEGKQSLLYLNRKGFAPFLTCSNCNNTQQCKHCDTTLTYYKKYNRCICHICGYRIPTPETCSQCESPFIVYSGVGTEALEEEVVRTFPRARVTRIDRDIITNFKHLHEAIERVAAGDVDIIVGTQMLGKGHDFPHLKVVGILSGDQTLHLPDFRSVEWTAQAIHQISGRAGRREAGEVYLQSRQPSHPLLQSLCTVSYREVFTEEYAKRKQFNLPPIWQMARFIFNTPSIESGLKAIHPLWQGLKTYMEKSGIQETNACIYPPTPCLMEKIARTYRVQLLIKASNHAFLHRLVSGALSWCKQNYKYRYLLDINPQQFL